MKAGKGELWRRYRKSQAAMIGLVILSIIIFSAIFAEAIVPYSNGIKNTSDRLNPPSAEHFFGTDNFGRDVFARVIHGTKVSLALGIAATLIGTVIGGILGSISAYEGGVVDEVIMRMLDIVNGIPSLLLAMAIVAAFGNSMFNLLIAVSISSVPGIARLVRSVVMTVAEEEFITAAHSYGCSDVRIIAKYILPNAMGPIIVTATMSIAGMILEIAALSFLGLGIELPRPEWGAMLSEARNYMSAAPYLVYIPGVFIIITGIVINLVGDGLRDAFDPKLRD